MHKIKLQRLNNLYIVTKNGRKFEFSTLKASLGFIKATRPNINWPNKEEGCMAK